MLIVEGEDYRKIELLSGIFCDTFKTISLIAKATYLIFHKSIPKRLKITSDN